jgi:hypothetical protein
VAKKVLSYSVLAVMCTLLIVGTYLVLPPRFWMGRDDVTKSYAQALFDNDEAAIFRLLPTDSQSFDSIKAEKTVREKLQRYAGKKLENLQISYQPSKGYFSASLSGTYQDGNKVQNFSEQVSIARETGPFWRFYQGVWIVSFPGIYKDIDVQPAIVP